MVHGVHGNFPFAGRVDCNDRNDARSSLYRNGWQCLSFAKCIRYRVDRVFFINPVFQTSRLVFRFGLNPYVPGSGFLDLVFLMVFAGNQVGSDGDNRLQKNQRKTERA